MIKVGVIGTGYMGSIHLEALSRVGGITVKSVCDINHELAEASSQKYNIEYAYDDHMKIIDDDEIEVVHNCSPNKYHYSITKEALERGKHILSEKPLAITLEEGSELVDLAIKRGVVTGVDFCYRYYPLVQEMAVRVRRGDLGDVRMVMGSYLQDWLSRPTDYSWRLEKSECGESNITADVGSHWFDLIQFVTGLKVTEVIGDLATIIPIRKRPKHQVLAFEEVKDVETEDFKVELEEYSSVLYRLSNDAPGSFTTSQVCAGRKSDTEIQVYGSKCSYAWNHKRSNEMWIGYREKPNEVLIENPILQEKNTSKYATLPAGHPLGYHDAVLNLFNDFYDMVKFKKETSAISRPTFATGYDEIKITNAILVSNKKRKWEKVRW